MSKLRFFLCTVIVLLVFIPNVVTAQSYKVVVGDIPGMEPLMKMITTMGDEMNVKIEIIIVPMPRMIYMLESKQADIGAPMLALRNKDKINKLTYDYSTDRTGGGVCFVLYTNKSKPIDVESLKNGNPNNYKIESDATNVNLFDFNTLPSTNVEGSLRKVDAGRIDGYIMGQIGADPVLKSLNLKNVKRQFFETYETVFALPKGSKGSDVDKFISDALKKIKNSKQLYNAFIAPAKQSTVYVDWQP